MENTYKSVSHSKYLILLAMLYVVVNTVPTLFLYRLLKIGDLILPGGMFIFPFTYMISDIVSEVYGYRIARLFIWFGILCNFIFAGLVFSILFLPSSSPASFSHEYYDVFHNIFRGDFANFVSVFVGNTLNIYILSKWKIILKGKYFIVRSIASSIVGETVMLILWGIIAFGTTLPFEQLIKLIGSDYLVRVIAVFVLVLPAAIIVSYLKKREQIDVYDNATNFNPFKLSL